MISENELLSLLKLREEKDWLDFKEKWGFYDPQNGRVISHVRDEMVKDILGLANGNSHIIKKTKYLIVGAKDKNFDSDGVRELIDVDYKVPTQSEITNEVNRACSPAIVGIEAEFVEVKNKRIYVVSIPPTFELHETTRELIASSKHSIHTVFMRQDEHIKSASVLDGITIRELKLRHRNETINPSPVKLGAFIGAVVALVFWNGAPHEQKVQNSYSVFIIQVLILLAGALIGAELGYFWREGTAVP